MFKPTPMSKISVFGSKKDMGLVIETLHNMKVYHIEEHKPDKIDIGECMPNMDEVTEALVRAKSILSSWKTPLEEVKTKLTVSKSVSEINKIDFKNRRLEEKKKELEEKLNHCTQSYEKIKMIEKLKVDPQSIDDLKTIKGYFGTIKSTKDVKQKLRNATTKYSATTKKDDSNNTWIAAFVDREQDDKFSKAMQSLGFSSVDISNLDSNSKNLKTQSISLSKKLKEVNKDIEKLKKDSKKTLVESVNLLSNASEKASAPLKFAVTESTFYITGFTQVNNVDEVKNALERVTDNRIHVTEEKIEKGEVIPTELDNPKPINSFEFFMDLYSLPKYKEIDPTFLMFLTFPIIFGLMLGDVGYGVVTLVMFLILRKMLPWARGFFNILCFASLWTIVCGLLYGEIFGAEIVFGYDLPRILSRLHQINDLLMFSIMIGLVHVNLGLLVGFFNEYRAHGFKVAFLEKISWMILQVGAGLIGASIVMGLPLYYGIIVIIASIVMLYKGEGVQGVVELPGIFGNILSYARIMAIGLASAGLALVVNDFAWNFYRQGFVGIIAGTLILLIGHIINIGLGILGPFLHSLRLHYVEFFTKFYKGGGKRFAPFGTN